MGMSTHVYGFRPPDERWRQMKQAWDACEAAGVTIPQSLWDFFGGEAPDRAGVQVELGDALILYQADMETGFEVHLDLLPADVKILRFVNSY